MSAPPPNAPFQGAAACRPFVEADRATCQAIAAEAALSSYGRAMPDLAARFTASTPLDAVDRRWVAVWDGRVVGFIDLDGRHIANLFVTPSAQGRGVGALLIDTVLGETSGDLTLSVFTINPRARALYERLGFTLDSEGATTFHGATKAVWRMRLSRPAAPVYRLVAFDFDGVLADSADWMLRTLPAIIQAFGLKPVTCAELQALRGSSTREILRALRVPAWKLPFIARRLRRLSRDAAGDIAPFPGVADLIARLHDAGVAVAIVSSNGEATIRAVLGEALLDRMAHLDCGVSLFGKAARLRRLVRRLRLPPSGTAYVGDETRDIDAARTAGVASLAVSWGYATRARLADTGPDALADTMVELGHHLGV